MKFLKWAATGDGQNSATGLDYAPLAAPVKARVAEAIESLTFNGQPLK